MKKAVISSGGKQYLVSEGEMVEVELIKDVKSKVDFKPLLVIDDQKIIIGKPLVESGSVVADVVEAEKLADKVVSIRYEAKKRVRKVRGHRQRLTILKIAKIS